MDVIEINVAKKFSRYPAGRLLTDGPYSGEKFREELLIPSLHDAKIKNKKLKINLDGGLGYDSSFLEESFGGAVRKGTLNSEIFNNYIEIVSEEDDSLIKEIELYVKDATTNLNK